MTREAADHRANQTNEPQRHNGSPATTAHEHYHSGYKSAKRSRWLWLSLLLPFGLGSWVPIVAGLRCGARYGTALGVSWSMLALVGWVVEPSVGISEELSFVLVMVAWVGGAVTTFALRSKYARWTASRSAFDLPAPRPDRRARWPWLSLLPLGLGAWAPAVAGVRCGMRRWTVLGVLWSALALAGWIVAGASSQGSQTENLAGALLVLSWVGGFITSFVIRPSYERCVGEYVSGRALWPGPTARSREWTVRYALIAYVVTLVVVVAVAAVLDYGAGIRLHVGVGVLMVDVILLGSLVPLKRRSGLTHRDLGLRAVPAARSVGLVIVALIAYIVIAGLWIAVVRPGNPADPLARVQHQSTVNVVLAIVAVAVSAPIVEEIFFRGLLYRSLRNRLPIWPAALLAGAMFGLVHITGYPLDTLPVKAAFGVIACLLYERTGSLLPGIGLHSFVDASAIDVSLTGNDLIVLASFILLAVVLLIRGTKPGVTAMISPAQFAEIAEPTP